MITIGPSGLGSKPLQFLNFLKSVGLNSCEIAFTHSIYMKPEQAEIIGKEATKTGISLSIHAPYYVNLVSEDKQKIIDSKKRILDSCRIGDLLTAKYIVFHAAYYQKLSKKECYEQVKESIEDIQDAIKSEKLNAVLCPETTGKATQFGDVEELVQLTKDTKCGICVDFSHIYARNIGKIDYDYVCKLIKDVKTLTCHFTGINYGPKGERNHTITEYERAKELLEYLKKYKINTRIINESPQPLEDALMMKKILDKL